MEKKEMEWIIDDTPLDFSDLEKYTDEEIEQMFQELFGEYVE